jgi:hypothetical protein
MINRHLQPAGTNNASSGSASDSFDAMCKNRPARSASIIAALALRGFKVDLLGHSF